jgi:two-component system, chemotaxis family, protein-glutamate methylesterase/glutaminase
MRHSTSPNGSTGRWRDGGVRSGGRDLTRLSGLPREFRPPIVIVQHRGKTADDALVELLRKQTPLPVSEPNDKELLEARHVYIAPADYHLLVEPKSLALSTEAPVNYARPSIDVLFESAAETHGSGVIGVVLTGANEDGATGAARIKQRGGVVLVQDVASAEATAMPAAVIAATSVDKVVPLAELPAVLSDLCLKRGK